jgi:ParB-like chromosome segregation protein Spo0J
VDELKANNYNPNRVAPPELELLKISIIEDGWTQPIVLAAGEDEIVDGYHRYLCCKTDIRVYRKTSGMVPTVEIVSKDEASQQMSTIRHNRARGTHVVLAMSKIVQSMIQKKLPMKEICERLQMEPEEVMRLAARVGIPERDIVGANWSLEWVPTPADIVPPPARQIKLRDGG